MADIAGTAGNDTLNGTSADDQIRTGGGNDVVNAGAGNDCVNCIVNADGSVSYYPYSGSATIDGGSGNDILFGTSGNDTLIGGTGNDYMNGGTGNDTYVFSKGAGADTITDYDTTAGNADTVQFLDVKSGELTGLERKADDLVMSYGVADQLTIKNHFRSAGYRIEQFQFSDGVTWDDAAIKSHVITNGTSGDDTLYGYNDGPNHIYGLDGNDYISGGAGNDTLDGGAGNDKLYGNDGDDTLTGGSGDDNLSGGAGNDTLYGGDGSDLIQTGDGVDYVEGGNGDDHINGYAANASDPTGAYTYWTYSGSKTIFGGAGNDYIYGGTGDDTLDGGIGNDVIYGGGGNDTLIGGDGDDYLSVYGSTGNSTLDGGDGNDKLYGGDGNNTLTGGTGDDILYGYAGDDQLDGGSGNDKLYGGDGNDTLIGGAGFDVLWGGNGNDTYKISSWDFYIYDTGGADTAIVSTSFVKIPSSIETVTYTDGARALPYWIDSLLADDAARFATLVGSSKQMAFAFPAALPTYDTSTKHAQGFLAFNSQQQVFARLALSYVSSVVDLSFVETTTSAGLNTISLANNSQTGSAGYSTYPDDDFSGSDLFINRDAAGNLAPADGTYAALTMIHELGHSLGLKHPFSKTDSTGTIASSPYLPTAEDTTAWTVMSYTDYPAQYHLTFSPLDLAALQYLYGPSKTARTGNDTYTLSTATPNFIWDGAGTDTLNASSQTQPVTLYLEPGYWGFIGSKAATITAPGQVTVNFGTVIENLIGGSGNDTLYGNDADNAIDGGAGNDVLYGGAGNDIFDWNASARGGNDTFYGGLGDDTFVLDSALDRVIEYPGEGTDTVWVSSSYSLANLPDVENLRAVGSTGLALTGNAENNLFSGSTGNDTIEGSAGIDTIWYSGVRASYAIAWITGGVTITSAADGTDTLKNVEFARFSNQTISLAPPISGGPGNDTLTGTTGADVIYGNGGDDRIIGMGGGDSIYGGSGIDTVVFAYDSGDYLVSKNPSTASYEVISKTGVIDYVDADVEKMEFRNIVVDANSYKYYGTTDPVLAGSVSSVYRFFNTNDNAFFYTNSVAERDTVLANSDVSHNNVGEWPYIYQGSSFEAGHTYAGAVPLERFYNTVTHHHFFTSSAAEAATVKANSASGAWPFVYEGVSFNVYASDPTPNGVGQEIAVERFYSATLNRHWFTADQTEIAQIRLTGLWADEGIGFWGEKPGT